MNNKGSNELEELRKLMRDFEFNQHALEAVIRREAADKEAQRRVVQDSGFALYSQTAFEGYTLLIRAYMILNAGSLSDEEKSKLTTALKILETLRQQDLSSYLSFKASELTDRLSKKAYILKQLDDKGEVYIEAGFKGHHAIIKYTKHGDVYTRTEFNEGDGSEALSPDSNDYHVWGVNQRLAGHNELRRAIDIDVSTFYSDKPATDKITALLPKRGDKESLRTTQQTVGNCSTRSTRALLRHLLEQPMLGDLFELATTPLDHIKDRLALQFYETGVHLGNSSSSALLVEINKAQSAHTPVPMAPLVFTNDMDVRNEVFSKLCDSIINQAEHLLQGTFVKNDELDYFKKSLLKDLLEIRTGDTSCWPYLEQESWPVIAFILSKNLIDNGVISKVDSDSSLRISKPVSDIITVEGIGKCVATASGAENQLGVDQALSERARSLISPFTDRSSAISGAEKAKLISEVKKMFLELAEPYRIDDDMLKIIETQMYFSMVKLGIPHRVPLILETLQSTHRKEIITATKTSLEHSVKLSSLRKPSLQHPATPTVGKLKIDKGKGISALLAKRESDKILNILNNHPEQVTDDFLNKSMQFAIEYNDQSLSVRLLKKGANIDTQDKFGMTLLMNAVIKDDPQYINALLDKGASTSLEIKNAKGMNILDVALEYNSNIAKSILAHRAEGGMKYLAERRKQMNEPPKVPAIPSALKSSAATSNLLPVPTKPSKEKLEAQIKEIEKTLPKTAPPKIPPFPSTLKRPVAEAAQPQVTLQVKKTPPPPPHESPGKFTEKLSKHEPSVSHTGSVPGKRTDHRPPPPPPLHTR